MEFVIKELEKVNKDEYLTNDKASFLRVNDVVVLHSIQLEAINGKDTYSVDIQVLTKNDQPIITVKSYCLSELETGKVLFSQQNINKKIEIKQDKFQKSGYSGEFNIGYLPYPNYFPDYVTENDINLYFDICVEVTNNGEIETKTIKYPIEVITYYTHPMTMIT